MLSCRSINIQNVKVFEVWMAWLRSFWVGEQCICDHMEVVFISFYRSDGVLLTLQNSHADEKKIM